MDEVLREFEDAAHDLRVRLAAGSLTGTDGERAQTTAEKLIDDYRARLRAEETPSEARRLLERFRAEAGRL